MLVRQRLLGADYGVQVGGHVLEDEVHVRPRLAFGIGRKDGTHAEYRLDLSKVAHHLELDQQSLAIEVVIKQPGVLADEDLLVMVVLVLCCDRRPVVARL